MNMAAWMVIASITAWGAAIAAVGMRFGVDILVGMLGPLVAASVSWTLMARTFATSPERLTSLMTAAFLGKMVFFAAYVTMALMVWSVRPVPFVVSFTAYFIALYSMEAFGLWRLFAGTAHR